MFDRKKITSNVITLVLIAAAGTAGYYGASLQNKKDDTVTTDQAPNTTTPVATESTDKAKAELDPTEEIEALDEAMDTIEDDTFADTTLSDTEVGL